MDWSVLGGNPVPGSPTELRRLAGLMRGVQSDADAALGRLRMLANQAGEGIWTGPAADVFRADLAQILPDLERFAASHGDAGSALFDYAQELENAQGLARDACHAAAVARDRRDHHDREADMAREESGTRAVRLTTAQAEFGRAEREFLLSQGTGDMAEQMRLGQELELRRSLKRSAANALAEAKARQEAAERAKSQAEAHLAEARRLAEQAREMSTGGGRAAVRRLNDAAENSVHGKPWYERAIDATVDAVRRVVTSPQFSQLLSVLDNMSSLVLAVGVVGAVVATAFLGPLAGLAVLKATLLLSEGLAVAHAAGTIAAWRFGAKSGKDVLAAMAGVLPGGTGRVLKWGGKIKRAINVADARKVTGFFRRFHAAPLVGPARFFGIRTALSMPVDAALAANQVWQTIDTVREALNPMALTREITSSLDNLDQYQQAEELFEDMGIQRPAGGHR